MIREEQTSVSCTAEIGLVEGRLHNAYCRVFVRDQQVTELVCNGNAQDD